MKRGQTNTHTDTQTHRLLDRIGPVGRFDKKVQKSPVTNSPLQSTIDQQSPTVHYTPTVHYSPLYTNSPLTTVWRNFYSSPRVYISTTCNYLGATVNIGN